MEKDSLPAVRLTLPCTFRRLRLNNALDFYYSVFGLVVRSNVAFPGVPPAHPSGLTDQRFSAEFPPEVQVHLGIAPYPDAVSSPRETELTYVSSYTDERGEPLLRIWKADNEAFLRLAYTDGTQFWLSRSRQHVWAAWPANLTFENALPYLLGPVFGLLLRLRGTTCLHASAVAFGDWSVVFVGPQGAGKSTTAAAFAKQGHAILSDDIVALATTEQGAPKATAPRQVFYALPAFPHLCLWPDSVKMLYGSEEPLPRLAPDWDKRRLSLGTDGTRFERRALPLGAIYLFSDRGPDPAPQVRPVRGQTSLVSLLANTYANNLLDRAMRAEEFAVLDHLAASVPIRLLTPHQDPSRLGQLCALIQQDFLGLQQSPSVPGAGPEFLP